MANTLRWTDERFARYVDDRRRQSRQGLDLLELDTVNRAPAGAIRARSGERREAGTRVAPKDRYGLAALFRQEGLPELECELVFHPVRLWRFDYGNRALLLAIEVEGGIWRRDKSGAYVGAHSHPSGIERDIEKQNAATLLGWRTLRYAPEDLGAAVRDVRVLLA